MIKTILLALFAATLIVSGAFAVKAFWIEPRSLVITRADITVPQWPSTDRPLKVAMLADIQAAGPHLTAERIADIVSQVNALQPDLIVLLGDYVSQMRLSTSHVPPKATAAVLATLEAPLGVHAVLGNHDWWLDGRYVRRLLEDSGITVYENETQAIDLGDGQRFWIAGLADLSTRTVDVEGTLAQVTDDAPVIMLSHSPDVFPEIPARVALTVAGHTHGGQIKLPYFGRLVVPSRFGDRYAYGHIIEDERQMFVSSGIGNAILPMRFGVPPEIVLLRIAASGIDSDHSIEESPEPGRIETPVTAHPGAEVDAERPDLLDRLRDIFRPEPAGEKDRDGDGLDNPPAQLPIVGETGPTE